MHIQRIQTLLYPGKALLSKPQHHSPDVHNKDEFVQYFMLLPNVLLFPDTLIHK